MQKSLLFLFLLFSSSLLSAQSKIQISRPDLSYINNTLTVKYEITGCERGQIVDISMIVVNSKGDTIRPTYINGDIGNKVTCGPGKSILWDVARDTINLDDDIEVMLTGKEIIPVITKISNPDLQKISRGTVLISSFFIPGLGQKKASGKAGHLVFSGLVYGLGGASGYFYMQHKKYYRDYQNASGATADDFFSKSEENFNMSQYMLYGAIGTWVTNMVWSAVIPIKGTRLKKPGISFIPTVEKEYLISAKWTF